MRLCGWCPRAHAGVGTGLQQVTLKADQRAGILTQASFLASHANPDSDHPVRRGVEILRHILCIDIEIPKDITVPPVAPLPDQTTRETFAAHSTDPKCSSCHQMIDPLGFAFEHYDAVGGWRDIDKSIGDILQKAITGTGTVATKTYDGNVDGSGTITLSGVVAGDDLGAGGTFTFSDKNAGTNKTVTLSGVTLTGADAGNYTLSVPASLLGDIVLCPAFARDHARKAGHSLLDELHLLTVHGVLHLLGYDHAEPDEERTMFGLQAELLADWRTQRAAAARSARERAADDRLLGTVGLGDDAGGGASR